MALPLLFDRYRFEFNLQQRAHQLLLLTSAGAARPTRLLSPAHRRRGPTRVLSSGGRADTSIYIRSFCDCAPLWREALGSGIEDAVPERGGSSATNQRRPPFHTLLYRSNARNDKFGDSDELFDRLAFTITLSERDVEGDTKARRGTVRRRSENERVFRTSRKFYLIDDLSVKYSVT